MQSEKLPIYRQRKRILEVVAESRVVVVESPTGSGKTTQLPVILFNKGYAENGMIGVTQPRRIATLSVCDYIAKQLGTTIPDIVGYKMRFEDRTDPKTKIKIMTDGTLLQELKADSNLSQYSIIIVDEAHERSLNIDFVLGMLKHILARRKDFRVLISSATINAEVFSEYFDECPIIRVDADMYPVTIHYTPPPVDSGMDGLIDKISQIVVRVADDDDSGDMLIFFSGEYPIKECIATLRGLKNSNKLFLLPLYGRLGKEEQERVFVPTPPGKHKVVVATNVAETSVTIDGITAVIDTGLSKINSYDPFTFTASLIERPISKASCNQRRGRAGRTAPGHCFRLYSQEDYEARPLFTTEEIYRTDLSEVVLRMSELGIREFETFDFLSPPKRQDIIGAVETLRILEAINEDNSLTAIGRMMAEFPLLPRHSRIIVEAIHSYPAVLEESVIAASFLSSSTPFLLPSGEEIEARRAHHQFRDRYGDFVSYIKLLRAFVRTSNKSEFCTRSYLDLKVMVDLVRVKEQLEEIIANMGIPLQNNGPIQDYLCAVSRGLIQFVCVNSGSGSYRSLTAKQIRIHPGSVMFRQTPEYIVAGEIVRTSRMFARSVSPIEKGWLHHISPLLVNHFLKSSPKSVKRETDRGKKKKRDTTWQARIGLETFAVQPYKGNKKIIVLEWHRISALVNDRKIGNIAHLKGLRAKIVYRQHEILTGARLASLLRAVPFLHPEDGILEELPVSRNLSINNEADRAELCGSLKHVLRLCKRSEKGKMIGFVALRTENGQFWFMYIKGFNSALTSSLSSMEELADAVDENVDNRLHDEINTTYRKLSMMLDS